MADATAETRPAHPKRQGSIDKGKLDVLEKRISERPNKEELVERNILKDDKGLAPSLVAKREELQKAQLQDQLGQALQKRPTAEELVKGGILQPDEAPAA